MKDWVLEEFEYQMNKLFMDCMKNVFSYEENTEKYVL